MVAEEKPRTQCRQGGPDRLGHQRPREPCDLAALLVKDAQQSAALQEREAFQPDHALQLADIGGVAQCQQLQRAEEMTGDVQSAEHQFAQLR